MDVSRGMTKLSGSKPLLKVIIAIIKDKRQIGRKLIRFDKTEIDVRTRLYDDEFNRSLNEIM